MRVRVRLAVVEQPLNYGTYWPFDDRESVRRFGGMMQALKASPDGGVAFFGAGTSAPAGFPTWEPFLAEFLDHFNDKPPAEDTPERFWAVLNAIDTHSNNDHAKALGFVRDTFARSVERLPALVQLARRTRTFRYFYTTNFDEILFQAAQGQSVAAYPDYRPLTARFVYLHGRASTATAIHEDLVLGGRGYRRAYDQEEGADAKAMLQRLARHPVVFLGFSMDDVIMRRSVEDIARAARRREERPGGGPPVKVVSPLKWYILLPAPARTNPRRSEEKRRQEEGLSDSSLQIIWYQDGGKPDRYRGLLEIVQRIQRESRGLTVTEEEPGFVERLLDAEELASVPSPSPGDVRRAEGILRDHPRIAEAFWSRIDGLAWFHCLRDIGVLEPPQVVIAPNGERRASPWMAAGLLRRLAATSSPEVAEFLKGVDTDNWNAVFATLEVLKEMDDDSGALVAPQVAGWTVRAVTLDSSLLLALSKTVRQLHADGKLAAAFALARATLVELEVADPTLEEWKAKSFVESAVPTLASSDSGLEWATSRLRTALGRRYESPDQDDVRRARPAIEEHRMNLRERSVMDLLIELVRDLLLATENAEQRLRAVADLLQSEWSTEKRIGIAHCYLLPSDFAAHEGLAFTPDNLANRDLFHELAKLLVEHTDDLAESSTQLLSEFAASLAGKATPEARVEYARWSRVLPAALLPRPAPEADEDDRDPEDHLFPDYISKVFHPGAPLDSQTFASRAEGLGPDALLDLVRNPGAAGVKVTWRHDPEEMWSLLADYAKEQDDLNLLLALTADDLKENASWRAVEAMPELAGSDVAAWESVLDWALRMVSTAPIDSFWSLGRLLEESAKSAPLELSASIAELALAITEKTKRTTFDDEALAEDSLRGGFSNSAAGRAAQALFVLVRREIVEAEAATENLEAIPQWFKDSVLGPLAADPSRLGIDAWLALGLSYSVLSAREPAAVGFVSSHLTQQPVDLPVSALAFWTGYLWAPGVYSKSLEQLQEAYRASAQALQSDALGEDFRDQFFQHLVIGALRQVPGYDDIVLETLGPDFTPETRGAIALSLGRGVEEAAGEGETSFRTTANDWFLRYWTQHVDRLGGQDGDQLAQYLPWLRYSDLLPSRVAHLAAVSVDQAEDGFPVDKTVEYLDAHVETEPAVALDLLGTCVDWYRRKGYCWLDGQELRDLLDRLAPLTLHDVALKDVLEENVLEGFAELGVLPVEEVQRYLSGGAA